MSKEYFNPSMRYDLHFHRDFSGHDCPGEDCIYNIIEELGVRIVYCVSCKWAMKRDLGLGDTDGH